MFILPGSDLLGPAGCLWMVFKCTEEMGTVVWIWREGGIRKVVRAINRVRSVPYDVLLEIIEENRFV